jgi:hypothetical protein
MVQILAGVRTMRRSSSGFLRFAKPGVAALALLLLALPARAAFDEPFHQTYPLGSGGIFSLTNVNGSVRVEAWEREEVEIHAVKTAERNPDDLRRVHIAVQSGPQVLEVRTVYPEGQGVEVNVEYRVKVPARVVLRRVDTVNGSVLVRGVEGSGRLASVNGNVEVLDSAGRFSVRTTNGLVRLELRQLAETGEMTIETVNGPVVLALPAGASANLDVRSVTGEFRSEFPVLYDGFISREFRGRIGRGGGTVRIRTVNGGIQLVVARGTV